jgi:hypothetical protein
MRKETHEMADFPVGKAQQIVLQALGKKAQNFSEATKVFEEMGIVVGSKREGRSSVPVVTVKNRWDSCRNSEGEGEIWRAYEDVDLSAVAQWVKK